MEGEEVADLGVEDLMEEVDLVVEDPMEEVDIVVEDPMEVAVVENLVDTGLPSNYFNYKECP